LKGANFTVFVELLQAELVAFIAVSFFQVVLSVYNKVCGPLAGIFHARVICCCCTVWRWGDVQPG